MSNLVRYRDYFGSVEFSAEDEVFHGRVLGINDLVTFEGESVSGLKRSFRQAVEDYLHTCKQLGKEPDKTYKGSFNVRISSDLHRKAALLASSRNISLNDFIKFALGYVIRHERETGPELDLYSSHGDALAG